MNQMRHDLAGAHPLDPAETSPIGTPPADLAALARMVRIDAATGDLVIANGAARLVLKRDGTVRVEGVRIVGTADEAIALHAAVIDLN
ncbi:hypothetical protein DK419_03515 [Methylobacterium terrae]|uniref:Uncharacterized protein n=1 Tax=Methylobacterium terrae TaxID=2202827 RepID=A0A2U8WJ18_9HYPH|nr:hypothetical protein [Methylobacterium terrae]AWN45501.1 hypothetical protein DK419_03515 [Methylobacterium terrae]